MNSIWYFIAAKNRARQRKMHRQVMILAGILAGIMAFTALVSGQGFIHIPGKLVHVSGGLKKNNSVLLHQQKRMNKAFPLFYPQYIVL